MSAWHTDPDEELSISDDEMDSMHDSNGHEAVLFVVDAYLQTDRLLEALKLISDAFVSSMLGNDKDVMCLIFANTQFSPPPVEKQCLKNIVVPANCAVFLPLRQLTKATIKDLLEFIGNVKIKFASDYGLAYPDGRGSFADMISLCIDLLEECDMQLNNAKIVYITNVEEPQPQPSQQLQTALQKANDLKRMEIEFHVIPMIDDFDYEPFYKEFITLSKGIDVDSFQVPDAKLQRNMLKYCKFKQDVSRHSLGNFNLVLGANLAISVRYYNYFQRSTYPKKVHILRGDNRVVRKKSIIMVRIIDEEKLEFTHQYQAKMTKGWHDFIVADQKLRVPSKQVNRVLNLHPPGMMLLGFKQRSAVHQNFFIKSSHFMYPDDESIIGSKRLFRALWQRCLEREKIAICLFKSKSKYNPRYVALVPVKAAQPDDKNYISLHSGDGFKIVYLPEAKHMSKIDFCEWNNIENTASDEGLGLFQKIIKQLSFDYQPNIIKDLQLDHLQSRLLALALNIKTEPKTFSQSCDSEYQHMRIKHLLCNYDIIFKREPRAARKPSQKNENLAKKHKVKMDELKNRDFVMQLISNKRLEDCTSSQLYYILDQYFGTQPVKSVRKQALVEYITILSSLDE